MENALERFVLVLVLGFSLDFEDEDEDENEEEGPSGSFLNGLLSLKYRVGRFSWLAWRWWRLLKE